MTALLLELLPLVCLVVFTVLFGGFGIYHESQWQRRLERSNLLTGRIVATEPGDEYDHAVVEFQHEGKTHRFTSSYGTSCIRVGKNVRVAYDTATDESELVTLTSRYFFTVVPLVIGFCPPIRLLWSLAARWSENPG